MPHAADHLMPFAKHEEKREQHQKKIYEKRDQIFQQPVSLLAKYAAAFSTPWRTWLEKSASCMDAGNLLLSRPSDARQSTAVLTHQNSSAADRVEGWLKRQIAGIHAGGGLFQPGSPGSGKKLRRIWRAS